MSSSTPFLINFKSNDDFTTELSLTLSDITVTSDADEESETVTYDLTMSNNSGVCSNPGTWFYMCDGTEGTDYTFASTPSYDDGTVTFALTAGSSDSSATYQIRYQPELDVDTSYKISCTVTLDGGDDDYFLYGNTYWSSKDLTQNEDGTYTVVWTGTVSSSSPFMIQIKTDAEDGFAHAITLTVTDIVITEITE